MLSDQRPLIQIAIWLSAICFSCAAFVSAQDGPSTEPPRVVVVRVTPSPRARIGMITIQNETAYSEAELRGRLKLKPGSQITSDRLNRAAESARKWLAQKDYLGARVTLHRGTYDAESNTVPLEVTFH